MKIRNCLPLVLMSVSLLNACSFRGVDPWDRDLLAKPEMELLSDPLETATDEHIYFSKEATSGGQSFGGGGCGCN